MLQLDLPQLSAVGLGELIPNIRRAFRHLVNDDVEGGRWLEGVEGDWDEAPSPSSPGNSDIQVRTFHYKRAMAKKEPAS